MDEKHPLDTEDTVLKVDFPKEGGTFSWLKGRKFPFPGFPHGKIVANMAMIKRMIKVFLYAYHSVIKRDLIKPERYSKSVREIYRLFNLLAERENSEPMKQKWIQMRDFICMTLEFDNAYRFRVQDVLKEINLDEIKPTEGDEYYFSVRTDYNFGGKKAKESKKL